MLTRVLLLAAAALAMCSRLPPPPSSTRDKSSRILINYGVGGNADTEARVYQRHLDEIHSRRADDHPAQRARRRRRHRHEPARTEYRLAAGRPDGQLFHHQRDGVADRRSGAQDQALRLHRDQCRRAAGTWSMRRKDIVPGGMHKPSDIVKAQEHLRRRLCARDLARHAAAHGAGDHGPALPGGHRLPRHRSDQQGDAAERGQLHRQLAARLPDPGDPADHQSGRRHDAVPISRDRAGRKAGRAIQSLESKGIETFDKVYAEAFGKPASGVKWDAFC